MSTRKNADQTKAKNLPQDDIFMAAAVGDLEWLKQATKKGKVRLSHDKNGFYPIHMAALHGRLECLKYFIETCEVSPNQESTSGWGPLHLCISSQTGNRAFDCLEYLISKGADVNKSNEDGTTALHQAASEGHVQCLKKLIEMGAHTMEKDFRGNTPIDLAKIWGHRKCARILASQNWQNEKVDMAKQIQEMSKHKMQELLLEIESEIARLEPRSKPTTPMLPCVGSKRGAKANSKLESTPQRQTTNAPSFPQRRTQVVSHRIQQDAETTKKSVAALLEPNTEPESIHDRDWNTSNHPPERPYIPNLIDAYPRDPFTKMPTKNATPKFTREELDAEAIRRWGKPISVYEKFKVPKMKNGGRPVVYACNNIVDVKARKKSEKTTKPVCESTFHISNDPDSILIGIMASNLLGIKTFGDHPKNNERLIDTSRMAYV